MPSPSPNSLSIYRYGARDIPYETQHITSKDTVCTSSGFHVSQLDLSLEARYCMEYRKGKIRTKHSDPWDLIYELETILVENGYCFCPHPKTKKSQFFSSVFRAVL